MSILTLAVYLQGSLLGLLCYSPSIRPPRCLGQGVVASLSCNAVETEQYPKRPAVQKSAIDGDHVNTFYVHVDGVYLHICVYTYIHIEIVEKILGLHALFEYLNCWVMAATRGSNIRHHKFSPHSNA